MVIHILTRIFYYRFIFRHETNQNLKSVRLILNYVLLLYVLSVFICSIGRWLLSGRSPYWLVCIMFATIQLTFDYSCVIRRTKMVIPSLELVYCHHRLCVAWLERCVTFQEHVFMRKFVYSEYLLSWSTYMVISLD